MPCKFIAGTAKIYEGGSQPVSTARGPRALDPGLEEDPEIFVELVDKTFYQASHDGVLVAIIADYPGLLPASHVSKTGVLTSEKDPFCALYPGKAIGALCRTRGDSPTRGTEAR